MPNYLDGISDFSHCKYEELLISGIAARLILKCADECLLKYMEQKP